MENKKSNSKNPNSQKQNLIIDFFNEFKKDKTGMIGLSILIIAILISLFEPLILTYKEAPKRWRDINYWQDNPVSAPPVWINFFQKEKASITSHIDAISFETNYIDGRLNYKILFEYDYNFDKSPVDLIFHLNIRGNTGLIWKVARPDNESIILYDGLCGMHHEFYAKGARGDKV